MALAERYDAIAMWDTGGSESVCETWPLRLVAWVSGPLDRLVPILGVAAVMGVRVEGRVGAPDPPPRGPELFVPALGDRDR